MFNVHYQQNQSQHSRSLSSSHQLHCIITTTRPINVIFITSFLTNVTLSGCCFLIIFIWVRFKFKNGISILNVSFLYQRIIAHKKIKFLTLTPPPPHTHTLTTTTTTTTPPFPLSRPFLFRSKFIMGTRQK